MGFCCNLPTTLFSEQDVKPYLMSHSVCLEHVGTIMLHEVAIPKAFFLDPRKSCENRKTDKLALALRPVGCFQPEIFHYLFFRWAFFSRVVKRRAGGM